jgi:hypothetical protein
MVSDEMYKVAWRRRHDINERALFAFVRTKLGAETRAYLATLEGRNPNTFHITNHFSEKWMMDILKDAYSKFGLKQYEFLNRFKSKDEEEDNFNEAWLLLLLLRFRDITQFIVVLGIIATIKYDIQKFVDDKVKQGIPASAIITLLSVYLAQKNIIRSQTIARTEVTKIMNLASDLWASLQPKVTKKKWMVILDGKERKSHHDMDGYPAIPLNEKFLVGGYPMAYPGDGSAPASEIVNCRCGVRYI